MTIKDRIIQSYESQLSRLPDKNQLHWLLRRYRTTEDQRYLPRISKLFTKQAGRVISRFGKINDFPDFREVGKKMLSDYQADTSRKAKKVVVYQKKPEILVYMRLLLFLFLTKSLGLEKYNLIAGFYKKLVDYFAKNDVAQIVLSDEFILVNPSEAANTIYYLKYLGISDNEEKLLVGFKNLYLLSKPTDNDLWLGKIYAFTHLVIAASNYYQNFIEKDKFIWVYEFFEKNLGKIIDKTNPDVVGEVGLSFKLSQDFSNPAIGKIKEYLGRKFDQQLNYVPRETENSLRRAEHRNIIAVMLLSEFTELYPGPDLLNYLSSTLAPAALSLSAALFTSSAFASLSISAGAVSVIFLASIKVRF